MTRCSKHYCVDVLKSRAYMLLSSSIRSRFSHDVSGDALSDSVLVLVGRVVMLARGMLIEYVY